MNGKLRLFAIHAKLWKRTKVAKPPIHHDEARSIIRSDMIAQSSMGACLPLNNNHRLNRAGGRYPSTASDDSRSDEAHRAAAAAFRRPSGCLEVGFLFEE